MPRHLFIDTALTNRAYENVSLPIGFKQTISQPYIVAKMTELLHERDSMNNVLEIGTGSGYQTSILSMLFNKVTTIERISALHDKSRDRLSKFGFKNITFILGDGHLGEKINAPYDAIIVTAAASEIPSSLLEQLTLSGRLILPLKMNDGQRLVKLKNTKNGLIKKLLKKLFLFLCWMVSKIMTNFILSIVDKCGSAKAIFYLRLVSFIESIFFPIPTDVLLAPMVLSGKHNWINITVIAVTWSVLGGIVGYYLGFYFFDAIKPFIHSLGIYGQYLSAKNYFEIYGIIFYSLLPSHLCHTKFLLFQLAFLVIIFIYL